MGKRKKIPIKTEVEIKKMRVAGEVASTVLQATAKAISPGKTTLEIDQVAAALIEEHGATSAFLGYRGYPGTNCNSVNDEVVHGIGGSRRIQP